MDEIVGKESLNHFGEYEDDSVFVRNDRLSAIMKSCLTRETILML